MASFFLAAGQNGQRILSDDGVTWRDAQVGFGTIVNLWADRLGRPRRFKQAGPE